MPGKQFTLMYIMKTPRLASVLCVVAEKEGNIFDNPHEMASAVVT